MTSVAFIPGDLNLASFRYRGQMPQDWLLDHGYPIGNDVVVLSKHAWADDYTQLGDRYIFDICDDHFDDKWESHYRKHCDEADLVTCNSEAMADRIKTLTGRSSYVIPDPFEYKRKKPHSGGLMWFGHRWNLGPLERVMPDLPDVNLDIVTRNLEDTNYIEWSHKSMKKAFKRAGIVLIPVCEKRCKSANRMIEAINAGCFVVAEPMPCHDEFRDYVWIGDIGEGVGWALDNPLLAMEMTRKGQSFIDARYSMDAIGPMWRDVIDRVAHNELVACAQ